MLYFLVKLDPTSPRCLLAHEIYLIHIRYGRKPTVIGSTFVAAVCFAVVPFISLETNDPGKQTNDPGKHKALT